MVEGGSVGAARMGRRSIAVLVIVAALTAAGIWASTRRDAARSASVALTADRVELLEFGMGRAP